ncbi:MAG: ABC transporter substrate-binding protein [Candidatus Kariarchaeaceae archaeon]|jgi:ABC-type transport system substrate-binding protein
MAFRTQKVVIILSILQFILITPLCIVPTSGSSDQNIPIPVFSLDMLSPDIFVPQLAATVLSEQLPQIGINVTHRSTSNWRDLDRRTYFNPRVGNEHNGAGRIPTYDEGGYDIYSAGSVGGIDYDPSVYSNEEFSPQSVNLASYDNEEISTIISRYVSSHDIEERIAYAYQIQQIANEDQPYIPLHNAGFVCAYDASWKELSESFLLLLSENEIADGWKEITHPNTKNLVYGHREDIIAFNPFEIPITSGSYTTGHKFLKPVFSGLYEREPTDLYYSHKSVIAKSMPIWNENKTIATIEIREDARFSTGEPITIDDVVNSFRMHLVPNNYKYDTYNYDYLTKYIASNASIVKINDTHLSIKLKRPYFLANKLFSLAVFDMDEVGVPDDPHGGEDGYDFTDDIRKYHGAGPFEIDSVDETSLILKKVSNYWNDEIQLDTIEFKKYDDRETILAALINGEVHILDHLSLIPTELLMEEPTITYKRIGNFITRVMVINMDHPIIGTGIETPLGKNDPSRAFEAARYIRQAIAFSFPLEEFMANAPSRYMGSIDAFTPIRSSTLWPPQSNGFDPALKLYEYDIAKARELMEMAGYELNFEGGSDKIAIYFTSVLLGIAIVRHIKKRKIH